MRNEIAKLYFTLERIGAADHIRTVEYVIHGDTATLYMVDVNEEVRVHTVCAKSIDVSFELAIWFPEATATQVTSVGSRYSVS